MFGVGAEESRPRHLLPRWSKHSIPIHRALQLTLTHLLSHLFFCLQIIKQCQVILNFLAAEGRLSTQHVDCIWAAAQVESSHVLAILECGEAGFL